MNNTNIGWTDYTWNPVTGCKHGCEYCYARKLAETRLAHIYPNGFEPTFWENRLNEPKKVQSGRKIFTVSMGDLFGEWVSNEWIEKVLNVVRDCPQHTFQFLTKNPDRYLYFDYPDNVILGTTVTKAKEAFKISKLSKIKQYRGVKIFVSFEPLLEDVIQNSNINNIGYFNNIDWVIIGAQTGDNPKQPKQEWVLNILSEANKYNIPVFIKNNLDWDKIKPKQFLQEVDTE
ncbi:MAG: DUF5131 family protein [Bacillota bacterium]